MTSGFERIATRRPEVELRMFSLDLLDDIVAAANHAEISTYMSDHFPYPYSRDTGRTWLEATVNQDPPLRYAIHVDGMFAGGTGAAGSADETTGSYELGWWLTPRYWGRGVATDSVAALVDGLFSRRGAMRVHASVMDRNPASSRVAEKVGMVHEANLTGAYLKRGVRYDRLVYGITRARWEARR